MSLLDEAKKFPVGRSTRRYTNEHYELTKAWIKGEITITQIAKALIPKGGKVSSNRAYNMLIFCMRDMVKHGILQLKK